MIIKKLTSKSGVTLVELMVSIAVILLVSGCITVGIGTAYKAYDSMIFESESENLVAAAETVIEDILKPATNTVVDETAPVNVNGVNYYPVISFDSQQTYDGGDNIYYKYSIDDGTIQIENGKFIYIRSNEGTKEEVKMLNTGLYHKMKVAELQLQFDKNGHFRYSFKVIGEKNGRVKSSGWYYVSTNSLQ